MFLVFHGEPDENNKALITSVHYKPELLSDEIKAQGILYSDGEIMPEPEHIPFKAPVAYVDVATGEITFEYVDRPETLEEKTERLDRALQTIILDMLSGGES